MNQTLRIPEVAVADHRTTQEAAYQRLRHAIMIGAIAPGTSLTIRRLAETFSLSPTPIREALRRLASERAVDVKENRRIEIPAMTAARFEDLIGLRITLECHAARAALPFVSNHLVEQMQEVDRQMDHALEAGNLDALTALNHDFHGLLYAANPEQSVLPLVESLWLQLGPFHRHALQSLTDHYHIDRHKEVLLALLQRDAAALLRAIEADIRDGVLKAGLRVLEAENAGPPDPSETYHI